MGLASQLHIESRIRLEGSETSLQKRELGYCSLVSLARIIVSALMREFLGSGWYMIQWCRQTSNFNFLALEHTKNLIRAYMSDFFFFLQDK